MDLLSELRTTKYTKRDIFVMFFIVAVYSISGKVGLSLAFINTSVTTVWPPTGIALAALLLFGWRIWPAIFLGAFLTNILTAGTIATSFGIAGGNTLEALVGAYFITTFANGRNAFESIADVFKFTLFAAGSVMVSATLGVTSLALGGFANWENFNQIWLTWYLGDLNGALIIAPFLLLLSKPVQGRFTRGKILERAGFFFILFFTSAFIFGSIFSITPRSYPIEFLSIPLLIFAALRFGQRETITAVVILSGIAIWGTIHGYGPFFRNSPNESLLLLQSFTGVISLMALVLTAVIREQKKAEELLQNNELRFRALIEKSYDAVSLTDSAGNISYVSPSFSKILGYSPEEVVGKSGFIFIHPDDIAHAQKVISHILDAPGESVIGEIRCRHKNGSWRNIEVTSTNLISNPNVQAVVSNFHDITERKQNEEKLAQEKAEDEALITSIGDGIIATDKNGKIILINKAFEEMIGWKKKEVLGKHTFEVLHVEDDEGKLVPSEKRTLYLAVATGKKITATHYLIRKNKTKFPALIVATPVILRSSTIGAIEIFHDMTKEKEIDRAKTEFVSLASHQLRTPPSIIKWYTELVIKEIEKGRITKKQKRYLQQIYLASQRMIELVNALLNISRLELGTFVVQPKDVDIIEVAKQQIDQLRRLLTTKKLILKEVYSDNLAQMHTDPELLIIILQNLFSNAIKYTPEKGTIRLEIVQEKNNIQLSVSDTGYGIPKNQQAKIFTKLFRADNIKTIDTQGTGLGLYLVKSILDRIGGEIHFTSGVNKGTTFTVRIPLFMNEEKSRLRQKVN